LGRGTVKGPTKKRDNLNVLLSGLRGGKGFRDSGNQTFKKVYRAAKKNWQCLIRRGQRKRKQDGWKGSAESGASPGMED